MIKNVAISQVADGRECRIPVEAIDSDTIECLEDLDAAIAALEAVNLKYSNSAHVAEWEGCEW